MPPSDEASVLHLCDTITKLPADAAGRVIVSGSHGGRYPGYLAALGRARGVILNDAGVGRDGAGIAALAELEILAIPAATVSYLSCRIGDAADALARGIVSHANAHARALGAVPGVGCREAVEAFRSAPLTDPEPAPFGEARHEMPVDAARRILLLDSASLVRPEDTGHVVVTGSHGGLVGGKPAAALRIDAFAAVFNDAGIGMEEAGVARLAPLNARGIAAFTVAAASARIGDAHSTYADGIVSRVNGRASGFGVHEGDSASSAIERLARL